MPTVHSSAPRKRAHDVRGYRPLAPITPLVKYQHVGIDSEDSDQDSIAGLGLSTGRQY